MKHLPNPYTVIAEEFQTLREQLSQIQNKLTSLTAIQRGNLEERLTIAEVSKEFKVSKNTIHKLMNEGELPFEKIGRSTRFRREDVQKCFAKNRVQL